ncbi:MAG: hypothetical protein ACTS73_04925 [Arsenophonus sp. NEOnobi-MAG3]
MSDEIFKKFNARYLSLFIKLIINKKSILFLDEAKWYEIFACDHEISYHSLIKLDN